MGNDPAGLGNTAPVSKGSPWWPYELTFDVVCWTKVRWFGDIFGNSKISAILLSTFQTIFSAFCDPLAVKSLLQCPQGCPRLLRDSSLWGKCLGTWCWVNLSINRKASHTISHANPDVQIRWRSMTRNVCVCIQDICIDEHANWNPIGRYRVIVHLQGKHSEPKWRFWSMPSTSSLPSMRPLEELSKFFFPVKLQLTVQFSKGF